MAAHSHHLWPYVTGEAHDQYWRDSIEMADNKWGHILGTVLPESQRHIAGHLRLPDPTTIAFAPNTHEFIVRIASALSHGFTLLIEGDARGADRLASEWADAHGIEHVKYHADWENLGQRRGRSGTRRCFRKGNPTWWWRSLAAAGRLT